MAYRAFTWRAILVGVALSVVVAMYSAYAGLKVGGVYWPIITATIMSFGILRVFGKTNKNEVNVAATAASTGGLLAAGIIFTVPAIWLLGLDISVFDITFIAVVGGLLGVLFAIPLRTEMIERLKLPYPDGTATARVLEAGDEGRTLSVFAAKNYGLEKHIVFIGKVTKNRMLMGKIHQVVRTFGGGALVPTRRRSSRPR